MKRNNRLIILRAIRALGPVSRVRLQQETTLSWGTITTSSKELMEREIIKETGPVSTGVGRRPVELDVNTTDNFVVGVRLGSAYISAVVLDAKGNVVADHREFVDAQGTPEILVDQLFEAVSGILDRAGVQLDRVAGIGIAAPGAIDADEGLCLYAPHLPNWKNVSLSRLFEERFGRPCFVDHVNNCSALGQMWFGLGKGLKNFLCVLLGTGISAGIMIDGHVYRGVNCAAGEFGHICIDPDGPPCACGGKGCLEVYATGPAIAGKGREVAAKEPLSAILKSAGGRIEGVRAEDVYQAALQGDPAALKIFEEVGFYLGLGVGNLINIFNPDRIILSGGVSQASEFFLPTLLRTIEDRAWHISKKEIKISMTMNAAVLGAAGIVLEQIYSGGLLFAHSAGQGGDKLIPGRRE